MHGLTISSVGGGMASRTNRKPCVLFLFERLNQWESLIFKTYHTGLTGKTNYRYSTWATVPLNFLRKNVEPVSSRLQKCLQNAGVVSKSDTKW
jgi:hypothetical protein